MTDRPTIGFIGLGLMGNAMVERLQACGYNLVVMANRSRTNVDAALARGATEVSTAKEMAEAVDIVMLCMDTSRSVESRMQAEDGVIAGLSTGKTVIDFGTSLPGSTRMLGEAVAATGAVLLDAPLGRTPAQAVDGKLNIMGAGDKDAFEKVRPVLDDLGENVFHVGALGAGHTLKLINNFFGMTTACAMSEAFAMADRSGLDRATLYEVISAGPLRSGMMDFVKSHAVDGKAIMEFSIANASKDVGYYSAMADDLGLPSQMSGGTKNALGLAKAAGKGDALVPEMVDWFAELFSNAGKS